VELYIIVYTLGLVFGALIFYLGFRVGIKTSYKQANEEPYSEATDNLAEETD